MFVADVKCSQDTWQKLKQTNASAHLVQYRLRSVKVNKKEPERPCYRDVIVVCVLKYPYVFMYVQLTLCYATHARA